MTKDQEEIIGITIHSAVTGFLLMLAMNTAVTPGTTGPCLWVLATYIGTTFAMEQYSDSAKRIRVMMGSVAVAATLTYLFAS